MSRRSLPERIVLKLARLVAGPERAGWLDAMEAEFDHLQARRLEWALGSLTTAAKDRAARTWPVTLAAAGLAGAALAATALASLATSVLAWALEIPFPTFAPLVALAPLPFAVLLGAFRPQQSVVLKGALGFAAFHAILAITLQLLFAPYVYNRWEATLSAYALPPSGLVGSFGLWCFGAWVGASRVRRRGRL